jgi:hypothetical protein
MVEDKKILETIKDLLDVGPDDTSFDSVITIHIDSVFSALYSLGVGPKTAFSLMDHENPADVKWNEFLENKKSINMVRTLVYLRVKLLFDPPATSFAIKAIQDQIAELEFRLHVEDDKSGLEVTIV